MAVKVQTTEVISDTRALRNITNYNFPTNSNAFGLRYISTAAPAGGNDGDIWYKVY